MTALGTGAGFRQTSGPRTVHIKQIAPVPNAVLRQAKDASCTTTSCPLHTRRQYLMPCVRGRDLVGTIPARYHYLSQLCMILFFFPHKSLVRYHIYIIILNIQCKFCWFCENVYPPLSEFKIMYPLFLFD